MAMRKYILTSIAILPLLLTYSHAAQYGSAPVDPPSPPNAWVFGEDSESGTYLGVNIADVTPERLAALKLKEEKGVEVTTVDQDAPAGKAGIKEHDVILTMNGAVIESGAQLRRMIRETPAGRTVTLGLSRDGQPVTVKLQLGRRQNDYSMVMHGPDVHVEMPDINVMPDIDVPGILVMTTVSARSGLTVENITTQLGEFFGVKGGNGVLVRSVEKGSRAEKAGFHAGDVIVKINDQPVHDTSDFTHGVKSRNGNSISVGVVREKKEQNLNLTLPERREKDSGGLFEEESFDDEPLFQAQSSFALTKLQDEIAKLQPQIELAKEKALEDSRKAMDAARKSLCDAQKEFRQQSEKQREQMRKQQQESQQEFRKQQEQLRKQLEQARQTMRNWAEI
jgi:serine protease Do